MYNLYILYTYILNQFFNSYDKVNLSVQTSNIYALINNVRS